MADLAELDRAEAVKIAGANPSTGIADNFMEVDINGNAKVIDYSISLNGSAVPTYSGLIGGTDGTNQRAISVDTSGRIKILLNDASGSAINLGQGLMAASIPVVIASNQSTVTTQNTSASGTIAAVNPFNRLQVSPEPSDLLSDKFDSTLDPNRWTSQTIGTATDPSAGGSLNMAGGTTAGNAAIVVSVPYFTQKANVQITHGVTLKFESGTIITGAHRFWGLGTAASNTVAAPISDGIGWEIDSAGSLNACIYASGTKIYSQALTIPSDGLNHRYNFIWRTDKVAFFLDGGDAPSATASGKIPNVQVLPARFHVLVSSASTSPTLSVTALGIGDTGRNSVAISDGVYGFRKATVTANNDLRTQDSVNTSLSNGAISVTTSAIEAKVGGSRLVGRKALLITPTNGTIYWGSSNAVTTANGTPIYKGQSYPIGVTDNVAVWLIAASTTDVRIVEGA